MLFITNLDSNFVNCSHAWEEQRQFTYMAIQALGNHSVVADIQAEMQNIAPQPPHLNSKATQQHKHYPTTSTSQQ